MKGKMNKLTKQLSKLGKTMLIPLTATPIAGLLARISAQDMLNLPLVENAAWIVFGMMDLLFAIGAVMTYAKAKDKAIPIIASIISLSVFKSGLEYIDPSLNMGVFAGIVIGVMTAIVYNYSKEWKIPEVFIFFRGEKLVVTLAPLIAIPMAVIFSYIWIPCQIALNSFGVWIAGAGALGIFVYGLTNRLLLPVGLHHVINSYIYYELGTYVTSTGEIVKGEIPRFLAGDPTAGLILAMFFIPMMFGLPGACMAMYQTAHDKYKEQVKSFMVSSAITSFVSGITEPIEFSFMFVAPQLYVFHAFLTGLAGTILYFFGVHLGMSFNFCVIDYIINYNIGTRSWIIIPVGILFFFIYYLGFRFIIQKNDLETPGRQKIQDFQNINYEQELQVELGHSQYQDMAKEIIENVGGKENILDVECCTTRLHLELIDASIIDEDNIKKTGAKGIMKFSDCEIQIIIGSNVNRIAKEMKEILDNDIF